MNEQTTIDLVPGDAKPRNGKHKPPALRDESPLAMTPMEMLNHAVSNNAGVDVLEKLMALQERWEANQNRKAFDGAIAAAKAEITVIPKNKTGHQNKKYADFAAFARAVDPVLGKYGLTYRFRALQDDKIHVTCIISHSAGHFEENSLSGPADTTGSKNAIQAIGSTLTYLQRYSLVQALGLAASEDDDGKAADNGDTITEEQVEKLRAKIVDAGADLPRFLKTFSIERLEEMPEKRFDEAWRMLAVKMAKAATS